jgi:hypothetical protein
MPAMSSMTATCLLSVACSVAACTSEPDDSDVPDLPGCWPLKGSMAKGSIELGTGFDAYQPMPSAVDLVYGLQGGFHFEVRARIRGLEPGDTVDVLSKLNPITRFQAFDATGEPIASNMRPDSCGSPLGYAPASDGDGFIFPPGEARFPDGVTTGIFDKEYRVVVEVIDAFGGYARDEKLVIAHEPDGWNM